MPWIDDHEFSHRLPPKILEVLRGAALRPWTRISLFALETSRTVDADLEGCVDGIGDAAREVKKEEEVVDSGIGLGDWGFGGNVSSSSSMDMRRRFRGRKLGVISVEEGLEFMAIAAGVAQSVGTALSASSFWS